MHKIIRGESAPMVKGAVAMCWAWTHINTGLSMEYGPFDIVATARRVGAAVTGVPAGGLSFVAKKHLAVPNRQRPQGQEHINLLLTLASTVGVPGEYWN